MLCEDKEGYVVVYTGGACINNGRYGSRAGIGVWWGQNNSMNVSESVKGRQTNITAEIQACTRAILQAKEEGICCLHIRTDSKFTIDCATKWMANWRKNGWKLPNGKPVKNLAELQELDNAMQTMNKIKWGHVPANSGDRDNKEAHALANRGARMR